MNDNPSVNAAAMNDLEASAWLKRMSEAAYSMEVGGITRLAATRLPELANELQMVLNDALQKITYLELAQIARSAEQTIAAQEDLKVLHETEKAIRDSLRAIMSCFQPLRENQKNRWRRFAQTEDQESSALKTTGSAPDC